MARHVAPASWKVNVVAGTDPDGEDLAVAEATVDNMADPDVTDEAETDAFTSDEGTDAVTSDGEVGSGENFADDASASRKSRRFRSPIALAAILGLVSILALSGLGGWLGWRAYEAHRSQQDRSLFLQAGRQGALNLTTISVNTIDADVQRIVSSSTGAFHDNFQQRAQPFIDAVQQAQSQSQGTITEAGLESENGDEAQVLVALTVKTSNAGAPEQSPRSWRMRISVKKVNDDVKVSNVEFVP